MKYSITNPSPRGGGSFDVNLNRSPFEVTFIDDGREVTVGLSKADDPADLRNDFGKLAEGQRSLIERALNDALQAIRAS